MLRFIGLTSPVTYPRLLLASEPASQAKCQKFRRHGIRCTGSLAFLFFSEKGTDDKLVYECKRIHNPHD